MGASVIAIRPAAEGESDAVADLVFGEPDQETRRITSALYGVRDSEALRPMFRAVWRAGENWRQTFVSVIDTEIVGIVQCGRSAMRITPVIALNAVRALGLRALSAPKAMRLGRPGRADEAVGCAGGLRAPRAAGTSWNGHRSDPARIRRRPRRAAGPPLAWHWHTYTTNPARRLYERCAYVAHETVTDPEFERRTGMDGNVLYVKELIRSG